MLSFFSRSAYLDISVAEGRLASMLSSHTQAFEQVLTGLFGDLTLEQDQRKKSMLFGSPCATMLLLADGRRPSACQRMQTLMNKFTKGGMCGPQMPFRVMYSNKEFAETKQSPPEPMETLLLAFSSDYKVPRRNRRWIDLPGNNRARGLNSVPLRSSGDMDVQVKFGFKQRILGGEGSDGRAEGHFALGGLFGEDEEEEPENSEVQEPDLDGHAVQIFPWEASELLSLELLHMYAPSATVALGSGGGVWSLAAARLGIRQVAFTRTPEHKAFVSQVLTFRIAHEMLLDVDNGFRARRFLRREASLAGSTAAASEARAEVAAEAPTPAALPPAEASTPPHSSTSDED